MTTARIREASKVLRDAAESATPGPWTTPAGDEYLNWSDVTDDGEPGRRLIICENAGSDATYIALMAPPVALALADWLDSTARRVDERYAANREVGPALTLADAILGGTS